MTARFVAEYSIQLSYECMCVFIPDHNWLEPSHSHYCKQLLNGALDRIRTCDRSVRSRVLYPAELRVQVCLLNQTTLVEAKLTTEATNS